MAEGFPSSNRRILDLSGHGRSGALKLGPCHLVQGFRHLCPRFFNLASRSNFQNGVCVRGTPFLYYFE